MTVAGDGAQPNRGGDLDSLLDVLATETTQSLRDQPSDRTPPSAWQAIAEWRGDDRLGVAERAGSTAG